MKESFSSRMERKLGKYAIKNITLYLIVCYAFGYIIELVNPDFISFMTLEPAYILKGQIWRLFTWLVIPPTESNLFFVLIMLYFYYSIGRSLEMVWGTYRLNVYLISGMIFTILGSFVLYGIITALGAPELTTFGMAFSTTYINLSIFLAYAATFPDMQVLLFFLIPIKVKVLGIIYVIILVYECVSIGANFGLLVGMVYWVVIGASLLNFIIFFLTSRGKIQYNPRQARQRMEYRKKVAEAETVKVAKHKCAVCGRTSETNPELEFRFCSKCQGNFEYCNDHIFTHTHIRYDESE
ncbi:MAG: hypothetical protein IKQ83_03090 [Lachnospiraceae bacterium]|nr:hypothetical protein [Lachnospiraceae bacterium]